MRFGTRMVSGHHPLARPLKSPFMKWTLDKAATELGIHKDTLAKGLIRAGLTVERGSRFTTLEVFRGYMGDLKVEQTRKTRAEADRLELEMQVEQGNLITKEAAKKLITDTFAPLRAALVSQPTRLASRVNPSDPELAKAVLEDDMRSTLAQASKLTTEAP